MDPSVGANVAAVSIDSIEGLPVSLLLLSSSSSSSIPISLCFSSTELGMEYSVASELCSAIVSTFVLSAGAVSTLLTAPVGCCNIASTPNWFASEWYRTTCRWLSLLGLLLLLQLPTKKREQDLSALTESNARTGAFSEISAAWLENMSLLQLKIDSSIVQGSLTLTLER